MSVWSASEEMIVGYNSCVFSLALVRFEWVLVRTVGRIILTCALVE